MKKFNIPPGEFEVNAKKPNAKSNASETSSTVDILISNLIEDEENYTGINRFSCSGYQT